MKIRGHEVLWHPGASFEEWVANPRTGGIPLLAPWANRLEGDFFQANGKRHALKPVLGNLARDANGLPIHGLLRYASQWQTIHQDQSSVTSRLDFWRVPDWMQQFPFGHALEVTHRVSEEGLEVRLTVENQSSERLPVSFGWHPYFRLTDSPRDEWRMRIAAREQVVLSDRMLPTGERKPNPFPDPCPLHGRSFDDQFTTLTRQDFAILGREQKLSVRFGPRYPVATVYTPSDSQFVCIEPMTAETNALNREGAQIQNIAPGAAWSESFWVIPEGF